MDKRNSLRSECPVVSGLEATQRTVSGHHRPTSETPFEWRFAGGPIVARFEMLTGYMVAIFSKSLLDI